MALSACGTIGGGTRSGTSTSTRPKTTSLGTTTHANTVAAQRYEAPLPVAIQEAAAASTTGRLYVVGGYDAARNSSAATLVYDGTAWHDGPALPIAVNHPGAAVIAGAVYVAGGFTPNGATNRVFVLEHGATSWRELAPMRRSRGALALLSLHGHLYAIGGRDGTNQVATPETYDPQAGAWTDLPAMPAPRNHLAGFVDADLICVAGGRTPDTTGAIDCYDTTTAAWHTQATLPTATSGAAAALINGVTLVAGGEPSNETRLYQSVQAFQAGNWTTEPMLVPRHGTAFAIFGGRLWTCGGATAPGFQAVPTCTSIAR
jgi:hypothetical protein